MSGGSYDYVYGRIDEIELRHADKDPRRAAFQKLLKLVAKAMHDIEWVDSCDYGPGGDHEAIDACLAFGGAYPAMVAKAAAFDRMMGSLNEQLELERRAHTLLFMRWQPATREYDALVPIDQVPSNAAPGSIIIDQKQGRTSVRTYTGWDTVCCANYGDGFQTGSMLYVGSTSQASSGAVENEGSKT